MNFRETCNEIREMAEVFSGDFNTEETRAAIIDAISEHLSVRAVTDKTTAEDIDRQVGKFSVQVNENCITVTVPLI